MRDFSAKTRKVLGKLGQAGHSSLVERGQVLTSEIRGQNPRLGYTLLGLPNSNGDACLPQRL